MAVFVRHVLFSTFFLLSLHSHIPVPGRCPPSHQFCSSLSFSFFFSVAKTYIYHPLSMLTFSRAGGARQADVIIGTKFSFFLLTQYRVARASPCPSQVPRCITVARTTHEISSFTQSRLPRRALLRREAEFPSPAYLTLVAYRSPTGLRAVLFSPFFFSHSRFRIDNLFHLSPSSIHPPKSSPNLNRLLLL